MYRQMGGGTDLEARVEFNFSVSFISYLSFKIKSSLRRTYDIPNSLPLDAFVYQVGYQ